MGLSDKSLRYTSTANRESQLENPDSSSWEHFRMEPSLPGWGILHQGNFRKKFFTERVVRLWHRQGWSHQPWKCLKMGHLETWFSGNGGIWSKVD